MQNSVFREVASSSLRSGIWIRRRHRVPLMLAVGGVVIAIAVAPSVMRNSDAMSRRMDAIREQSEITERLRIQQDALTDRAAIADQRLQSGCNVIPNILGKDGRIASLAEGQQVINPDNGAPFPPGAVACDVYGGTAIVGQNGMLEAIAVTTNYDLVKQALATHGLKMQAGNPDVTAAQGSQSGTRP